MKDLTKMKRDFGNVINAYGCYGRCGCSCSCSCSCSCTGGFENYFTVTAKPQVSHAGSSYSYQSYVDQDY